MLVVSITIYQEAKQNSMKKSQLFKFNIKERLCFKSDKTENQELPENLPKIGKLFVRD